MSLSVFEWDEDNVTHAIRHGVSKDEIEEIILDADLICKGRSGAYLAYGQTMDGRYLLAVFEYKGRNIAWPYSARPLTQNEKNKLKRRT